MTSAIQEQGCVCSWVLLRANRSPYLYRRRVLVSPANGGDYLPTEKMGAKISSRQGGLLPVTITGTATPMPADHVSNVASAQIKSALLLAGLNARATDRQRTACIT